MTSTIKGIKSVDFKIKSSGYGVVNWAGNIETWEGSKNGKNSNHLVPKLRGFSETLPGGGNIPKKGVDVKKNPMYASNNCVRHNLFKTEGRIDLRSDHVRDNKDKLLLTITGLVRGYLIPENDPLVKKSSLFITDFQELLGNANFEALTQSGNKNKLENKNGDAKSASIFSKTTFGKTEYEAHGSIRIEDLQFISLDSIYGRKAFTATEEEGVALAESITNFLVDRAQAQGRRDLKPEATHKKAWRRKGAILEVGEQGILLNEDAVDVLVENVLFMIRDLFISQGGGYLKVDEVTVDYNDSEEPGDQYRILKGIDSINPKKNNDYAIFFEEV